MSHIIRELLKATNLVLRLENVGIFLGTTGRAASTPHTQQIPGEKSKCNEIPTPSGMGAGPPQLGGHQSPAPDFSVPPPQPHPSIPAWLQHHPNLSSLSKCPSGSSRGPKTPPKNVPGLRNPATKPLQRSALGRAVGGGDGWCCWEQNLWGCLDGADFFYI